MAFSTTKYVDGFAQLRGLGKRPSSSMFGCRFDVNELEYTFPVVRLQWRLQCTTAMAPQGRFDFYNFKIQGRVLVEQDAPGWGLSKITTTLVSDDRSRQLTMFLEYKLGRADPGISLSPFGRHVPI
jgi:hypothetical protein